MGAQGQMAVSSNVVAVASQRPQLSVAVTERIEDVAPAWHKLELANAELPGQKLAFVRAWLEHFSIPEKDRVFLVAYRTGAPIVVLPLWRKRVIGLRVLTWLTGDHLGSNAPLADRQAFAQMTSDERREIWSRLSSLVFNTDLLCLSGVPVETAQLLGLAESFDTLPVADRVYRSRFCSWADCDGMQRNKHRRKIDRQQGARLDALGDPRFEVVTGGGEVEDLIDTMFAQKAKRFAAMGIRDPFAQAHVRTFYKDAFHKCGGVLHVLRLDGQVVSVRYNLVTGNGMFSLISSMSDCERIQAGSPGKQNLLRVMQSVFEQGFSFVDMGRGDNDEKRLWTNEQIALASYSRALTPIGSLLAVSERLREEARARVKNNQRYFDLAKRLRKSIVGGLGRART